MEDLRRILLAVDDSDGAQKAFDFYTENMMQRNDYLLILHVHQDPNQFNIQESLHWSVTEWAKQLHDRIEESNKLITHFEMLCEKKRIMKKTFSVNGKPGASIVQVAKTENASMIIMGSRNMNAIRRTLVGGVSDYVLKNTHVPVTVVPFCYTSKKYQNFENS